MKNLIHIQLKIFLNTSEKEKIIDSFLEHRYNAVVSASQCFAVVKEKVTQDMLESEALKDYLRIYFTDYFMIVD